MDDTKQYDNTNRGVAWLNKDKKGDKYPDFQGTGNYLGMNFEIAVWMRKTRKGDNMLSLKFSDVKPKNKDGIPF